MDNELVVYTVYCRSMDNESTFDSFSTKEKALDFIGNILVEDFDGRPSANPWDNFWLVGRSFGRNLLNPDEEPEKEDEVFDVEDALRNGNWTWQIEIITHKVR